MTTIDAADSCTGSIVGQGIIRIDGSFEGKIQTKDRVVISKSGRLKADVIANEIIIGGILIGNIKIGQKTEIEAGARVAGEIQTGTIIIELGAHFEGRCTMKGIS